MSEPYYSQRGRIVCVSLSAFFFSNWSRHGSVVKAIDSYLADLVSVPDVARMNSIGKGHPVNGVPS